MALVLSMVVLTLPAAALRAQSAPPATVDGEVSDMLVKGKSLEVRYRNTGSTATDIVGEVQVRSDDDSLVAAVLLVEGKRIAAGRRETFRAAMPSLPPGKYTIYAVIDFGGESLTAAQAALEILP